MADNQLTTSSLPFRNFFINSYILPGFLFVITTILICGVFKEQLADWTIFHLIDFNDKNTLKTILELLTTKFSLITQVLILLIVIFISIITGNALSVFGSLIFDLLWLGKGIGWPYERILSYYPKNYLGRAIIVTLFTITNIICLIQIFRPIPKFGLICTILFIILIVKFIPKAILNWIYGEDKEIRKFLKSITEHKRNRLFETNLVLLRFLIESKGINKFLAVLIWIFSVSILLDISIFLAIFLGKFFGISHGLDKYSRKVFKEKMKAINPRNYLKNDTSVYWNTYITLVNENPENLRIANSHLKRSILIRNLAIVGVITLFFLFNLQPEFGTQQYERWKSWSFVWWFSTFLLFIGYNIIIYKYFTKYLIRCFIINKNLTKQSTTHKNV